MNRLLRNLAFFAAGIFFFAALASALLRPQGLPMMMERYREMKRLEREVRDLREQVHRKRHEVEELKVSDEARKRAVRQHLNKALPGETVIILPSNPGPAAPAPVK